MKPSCKQCGSPYHSKMSCKDNPVAVAKAAATRKRMQDKQILKAASKPRAASKIKKTKTPKKKTMSRSQLVKRLDSVFSQYVRLRDDGNGCITCGDKKPWKEMQACHFYTRGRQATRWHESNVFGGCYRCNVLLKGNYINYTRYMIDRFGREFVDQLGYESLNGAKISTPELREKIEYYRGKVAELLAK